MIVWAFVMSICLGGTCDDYVLDSHATPAECLQEGVKWIEELDPNLQYAFSCEQTFVTQGD